MILISEGAAFAPNASSTSEVENFLKINYPNLDSSDTKEIMALYPQEPPRPRHAKWYPSASRAYGEATFICPSNNLLNFFQRAATQNENPPSSSSSLESSSIWGYRYNMQDHASNEMGLGVPHVFEAPAVMGPGMLPPYAVPPSYWTYNADMVPLMMKYWISFARTLDPNTYRHEGAPKWENWGDGQRRMLMQLGNSTMETVDKKQQRRCEVWQKKSDVMEQ